MKNKKAKAGVVIFIVFLLAIFLVWGYLGGIESEKTGVTCEMGLGDFCWKWHTNVLGSIQEGIEDIFGGGG